MDRDRIRSLGKKAGILITGGMAVIGSAVAGTVLADDTGVVDEIAAAASDATGALGGDISQLPTEDDRVDMGVNRSDEASQLFEQFAEADASSTVNHEDTSC